MDSARTVRDTGPLPVLASDAASAHANSVNAELERAALRVAASHSTLTRFEQRAVREALSVLVAAIRGTQTDVALPDLSLYSWTSAAPSLLASLRRELLQAAVVPASISGCLQHLVAIERITEQLEHDVAAKFTEQFSGANALTLLMEVAHDMMSPLGAIQFLVERLQHGQSGPVTNAQARHLALVYSAAFGLSTMASDIMELSRGGSRLIDGAPQPFSVGEMLRGVRDLVQPVAEEKRLSVRFSGPPADRRVGHAAAIARVLLNLTTNALKNTTVGSITVLVEQTANKDELAFTVQDTGSGIPETELQDIFSAFARRGDKRAHAFNSAGLGLAICHKVVSVMGGTLAVESRVNQGSKFSFVLPLLRA